MPRPRTFPGILLTTAILALTVTLVAQGRNPGRGSTPCPVDTNDLGQEIFRFDTFGDEQLWTDTLRMHEVIEKAVGPVTALAVGLKVDADALPPGFLAGADLTDPATTVALLELNAVVGVKATVNASGRITRLGITCALCHSTVDDSVMPGIGRRLDGWPNLDLDPGRIIALSPAVPPARRRSTTVWGPGKYDPRFNIDGLSTPLVHAARVRAARHRQRDLHRRRPGVVLEQVRRGDADGRAGQFSATAARASLVQHARPGHPKLPALRDYQLSLRAPAPPAGSFDAAAAARGQRCSSARRAARPATSRRRTPTTTAAVLHAPAETGMDAARTRQRSATKRYRTTPLRGAVAAPAVLPRRQRGDARRRRRALREGAQARAHARTEGGSRALLEDAIGDTDASIVQQFF